MSRMGRSCAIFGARTRSLSLLCGLLGCAADEPTSVLVEVSSDLTVGRELTELRVEIFDRAGDNVLSSRSIALTTTPDLPAQYVLPASFALVPNERDVTDFRLVLTGRGPLGGGAVMDLVERQAIGSFVPHEQRALPIVLSRSCLGQLCRGPMDLRSELTCSSGACVSALLDSLPPVEVRGSAARAQCVQVGLVEAALESSDEQF